MSILVPVARSESVETFLFREARLLDERRFDEWLELFADDSHYWLPMGTPESDPAHSVSLLYDDWERMALRIQRLEGKYAFSQEPPSETCRTLANLEYFESATDGVDLVVLGVTTVMTLRRESTAMTVGRCRYHLRTADAQGEPDGWRIVLKRVDLLARNQALHNLSFII